MREEQVASAEIGSAVIPDVNPPALSDCNQGLSIVLRSGSEATYIILTLALSLRERGRLSGFLV